MNTKKIEAVIFDFDGTLVDSEENYFEADRILLKKHGLDIDTEFKKQYIGIGAFEMMEDIRTKHSIAAPTDELVNEKNEIYLEIASKNTKVFPEVAEFVKYLHDNGYKTAIASGSSKAVISTLLDCIGFAGYFQAVVSSDEVNRGKPEPDVFLEAAERLGVHPEKCLVMEDSVYGVLAAKKAGMKCCAIPYIKDKIDDIFYHADLFYEDEFDFHETVKWLNK